MFILLKKERLNQLVETATNKAGTLKRLSKTIKIPKSTLSAYKREKRIITEENLKKLEEYARKKIEKEEIIKILPQNWKQIKGGKNCVKLKKQRGIYEKQMRLCHAGSSSYMKLLHKKMKRNNPEKYYRGQYEKFKKIGGYKYKTLNGEFVRNKLEKDTADALKKLKIKYKYEPLINVGDRYFFPDFLINDKTIIECTMWRGTDKAIKLADKIACLKDKYKVYVLIPKALNNYYKILNNHLILGLDELVPVAQSGRAHGC